MYSSKVQALLKGCEIYSEIEVKTKNETYQGILMPHSGAESDYLVVKLKTGYNIGIAYDSSIKVRKLSDPVKSVAQKLTMPEHQGKKKVSIITTGGTITSKVDYKTGGVTSLSKPEELLNSVPQLASFISLSSVESPYVRMSESANYEEWQMLAETVAKKLQKDDGVMITHGTDTMHYTAAALSFMLNTSKPVVLTGSQRSSDRGSSDSVMNLVCSAVTAASDIAHVGICMHATESDDYCYFTKGTKVGKMNTSRRDTFRPINALPFASVYPNGEINYLSDYKKKSNEKVSVDTKYDPHTSLIKFHPGFYPKTIDYLVKSGIKGIIIEGTGLGHVALDTKSKEYSMESAIKNATASDVFVGFAPQTLYGTLNMNVYSEGRRLQQLGAVDLKDMLPETAYVKLGCVLGHVKGVKKVTEEMLKNYAEEFTERITPEMFLY